MVVYQREERGMKGGTWGSETVRNQEKSLGCKSIQLKQGVFMRSGRHVFPGEVWFKTSSRRTQYILGRQAGCLGFSNGSFPLNF